MFRIKLLLYNTKYCDMIISELFDEYDEKN